MQRSIRALAAGLALALVAGVLALVGTSPASAATTFSPTTTGEWVNKLVSFTTSSYQLVEARISGNSTPNLNGAVVLRWDPATDSYALANVRGDKFQIFVVSNGVWTTEVDQAFTHTSPGYLRARVNGSTLSATWNGKSIGSFTVPELQSLTGLATGVSVWQDSVAVSITDASGVTPGTSTSWAPTTANGWVTTALTTSVGSQSQSVEAIASGLTNVSKNAGLVLRRASSTSYINVVFSGTRYQIYRVSGSTWTKVKDIAFTATNPGVARAEINGTTVKGYWNGALINSFTDSGFASYTGAGAGLSVWQDTESAVKFSSAVAAPLPAWLSGKGGGYADGREPTSTEIQNLRGATEFGTWRGEPVNIVGSWSNGNGPMVSLDTLQPGHEYGAWTGPIDLALGGICKWQVDYECPTGGDTWAAAAHGDYRQRWVDSAQALHQVWVVDGHKPASNLYLRFAHEMNGEWFPWNVRDGEQADFIAAWKIWAGVMRQYLPGAHLVWSVNKASNGPNAPSIRSLWPGADVVDVYSVDWYNGYDWQSTPEGIAREFNQPDGFTASGTLDPKGLESHRELAEYYGVPFAVSEWANPGPVGSTDGGQGESPEFISWINTWFRSYAGSGPGRLKYEIYFNDYLPYTIHGYERHEVNGSVTYLPAQQPETASRYVSLTWGF